MRKFSEQPFINTEINVGLGYPSSKNSLPLTDNYKYSKYKTSSPICFGDHKRNVTPLQIQVSPIEMSRRESWLSKNSENFDFSVKERSNLIHNGNRNSIKPKRLDYDEQQSKVASFIAREHIKIEEQEYCNSKLKHIREETFKQLEQLEAQYLMQRQQLLTNLQANLQLEEQRLSDQYNHKMKNSLKESKCYNIKEVNSFCSTSVKEDPPLKSALKKKDSTRTQERYQEDDSGDDWKFIQQAKSNLEKQKTQAHIRSEEKSPGKVRFLNPKEGQKKKFKKYESFKDLHKYLKVRI